MQFVKNYVTRGAYKNISSYIKRVIGREAAAFIQTRKTGREGAAIQKLKDFATDLVYNDANLAKQLVWDGIAPQNFL